MILERPRRVLWMNSSMEILRFAPIESLKAKSSSTSSGEIVRLYRAMNRSANNFYSTPPADFRAFTADEGNVPVIHEVRV
jgi:hypothetical protein